MDKAGITPAVVERLLAAQFPQWADLPVIRVELDGWDNTTFRLGDEMSVRLPSGDAYTLAELTAMLEAAGFQDVRSHSLPTPQTVIVARK